MELLTDDQIRILAFIDGVNRSGYKPTSEEVDLWLRSPQASSGRLVLQDQLASSIAGFARAVSLAVVPGSAESRIDHCIRMKWIDKKLDRLGLTDLGRALLSASQRQVDMEIDADVMVLDREDPLSYPRLMGKFASFGEGILVDPYLRLEQLHQLITQAEITKILISKQYSASSEVRASMATYLGSGELRRSVEVRASNDADVHDRMAINAEGEVYLLGHSLNGIEAGSASTVFLRLPEPAGRAQRIKIESWWSDAETVNPAKTANQDPIPDEN